MRVKDVMTRAEQFCRDDQDCGEVAKSMAEWGVSSLPVIDANHHLVGMVQAKDLQRGTGEEGGSQADTRKQPGSQDEAVDETFPASDPVAKYD